MRSVISKLPGAGSKILLSAALAGALPFPASAFDSQKWENQDPSIREWFRGLHNDYGTPCCDFAEGSRVDDPDWRQNEDGSYSVIWKGQWTQLDPKRILKGTNRVGYAILWGNPSVDQPYCFIPGTRS